jgi:H+/Cl- antiporter ClcA
MYRNRPLLEKLFYSLIAALTAQTMSSLIAGDRPMMFGVENPSSPPFGDMRYWSGVVLMGVAIAFVGQLYRILSVRSSTWFQEGIKHRFARLLVGHAVDHQIGWLGRVAGAKHVFWHDDRGSFCPVAAV